MGGAYIRGGLYSEVYGILYSSSKSSIFLLYQASKKVKLEVASKCQILLLIYSSSIFLLHQASKKVKLEVARKCRPKSYPGIKFV